MRDEAPIDGRDELERPVLHSNRRSESVIADVRLYLYYPGTAILDCPVGGVLICHRYILGWVAEVGNGAEVIYYAYVCPATTEYFKRINAYCTAIFLINQRL